MTHIEAMKQVKMFLEHLKTHSWTLADQQKAIELQSQAIEQAEKQDEDCQRCDGKGCIACDAREQESVAYKTLSKIGKAVGYWRADLMPPHISPDSHDITPLYTSPQPQKPLTDEQIRKASLEAGMQEHYMGFHSGFLRFARAIEAAHGIKEKNT